MSNTVTKNPSSEAKLIALQRELMDEKRRLERLLKEVQAVLRAASPPSKPAAVVNPEGAPPRPSPLDLVREVVEATEDLRVANGNLSAAAVAAVFGVSLSQLAGWLGRSRQALSKTPDADS